MNLTDGGYICACYAGFIISADNRKKCEGKKPNYAFFSKFKAKNWAKKFETHFKS
jgi:hypothetical protein